MRNRRALAPVVLGLLVALFAAGMVRLFKLRFGGGDVYSPYSSLRADPLGSKGFHDSLAELPGIKVSRNLKPLDKLQPDPSMLLLYLGAEPLELDLTHAHDWGLLRNLVIGGARVVVSMLPRNDHKSQDWFGGGRPDPGTTATAAGASPLSRQGMINSQRRVERERRRRIAGLEGTSTSLAGNLNVDVIFRQLPETSKGGVQARPAIPVSGDLQTTIPWHSALAFHNLDPEWNVILERSGVPVVIERRIGRGSIVLMTDSYPFSNESAVKNPEAEFLAWVVGDKTRIVFDETHFGIGESPGIAALARQYRLHGFAGGVLLLVGLFLWRASSSLLPRRETEPDHALVSSRSSTAGLIHLLRRSIRPKDVLEVCMEEWKKSRAGVRATPGEVKRVEMALAIAEEERDRAPRTRNPVEAYRRISIILNERK